MFPLSTFKVFFKKTFSDEYIKNIATVASGVFITQILAVILSPIFTRIYDAKTFGIIGLYLSILNILTVPVTLRYENALVLPKDTKDAVSLFNHVIIFISAFAIFYQVVLCFFLDKLIVLVFDSEYKDWFYIIPLFVSLNAFFYLFRNWLIRRKEYKSITKAGVSKSIILNVLILILGLYKSDPINLLIANFSSQLIETLYLFFIIWKEDKNIFDIKDNARNLKVLNRYLNFPKYSLPSDLLNVYVSQNPIILFSLFFGPSTVGYFVMTQRILGLPIKLISSSTLEVFKQKCSEDYNKFGDFKNTFLKTFKYLVIISIIPTLIIAFLSPLIFSIFLGSDWIVSGYFARYLSVLFFFQFSVSPLGFSLIITNNQKINLIWQIILLILTSLGIYIGFFLNSSNLSVLLYSFFYSFMYCIYFLISYKSSKGD